MAPAVATQATVVALQTAVVTPVVEARPTATPALAARVAAILAAAIPALVTPVVAVGIVMRRIHDRAVVARPVAAGQVLAVPAGMMIVAAVVTMSVGVAREAVTAAVAVPAGAMVQVVVTSARGVVRLVVGMTLGRLSGLGRMIRRFPTALLVPSSIAG